MPNYFSPLKSKRERCPDGSRKNRKTGNCQWYNDKVLHRSKFGSSKLTKIITKPHSKKRCPRGSRKLGKTGKCSNKSIKNMTFGARKFLNELINSK